jgi:type III secretion system YscQ/HrcQ family protein
VSGGPIPPAFPEISGAEADLANRLYGPSGRIRIAIGGKGYRVAFLPAFPAPFRPALRLALEIGERRAALEIETVPLPELLGYPEGGIDPRDIPPPVLRAYLEGVLGGLRERAALRLGRDIVLAGAGPAEGASEPDSDGHVLHMEVEEDGPEAEAPAPVRARLHLAREEYADLAGALPEARPRDADGAGLPVAVCYRVGSAALTAAECAGLEAGDIVLAAADPMAQGGIRLCAGDKGRPLWKATWSEGKITLEEECEEDMPMGDEERRGGEAARLDALEVHLSFELGGRMSTLAELRGLSAGSVLEFPENPDARVSIRAGGKFIGTGSLIMVDGRAGVRVETLWEGARP